VGFAIVAAAAVTAGCGGGSSGNALALDPVSAAVTKTQHAGAARVRFALTLSDPQQAGKTVRLHGAGVIDGTSGELTFKLGSALPQAGLQPGATLKEIFLQQDGDYIVYMQLGFLAAGLPEGKHWIELNLSELGKSAGIDFGKLLSGSQFQPTDVLSMLKAEGAEVRKVGTETVDGAATTHYHVTVDMAKALQAKGVTSPLLSGMAAEIPKVPEDVWIRKDGLVSRVQISLDVPQGTRTVGMALTMDLYDYGAHVTIAAPPSGDVFDATPLAKQGLGSAFH
jgi:LppX_LprAFG lipoprotein